MTLGEFLVKLVETKKYLQWGVMNEKYLRGRQINGELTFCPLNAVCYYSEETVVGSHAIFVLSDTLKMNFDDASLIFMASDNCRQDHVYCANMRKTLERVLLNGPR